jgi:hypothetical protein
MRKENGEESSYKLARMHQTCTQATHACTMTKTYWHATHMSSKHTLFNTHIGTNNIDVIIKVLPRRASLIIPCIACTTGLKKDDKLLNA